MRPLGRIARKIPKKGILMNSIILTHFVTPETGEGILEAALDRLGAYLQAEVGNLEELLNLADCGDAIDHIEGLHSLHLNAHATPEDIAQLLEEAQALLERLLERVRTITPESPLTGPASSDFDAWVRWSGARLEDMVATLRHSLAA